MAPNSETEPRAALPLGRLWLMWRAGLFLLPVAAVGAHLYWLMWPSILSRRVGEGTVYLVNPNQIWAGVFCLFVAGIIGVETLLHSARGSRTRSVGGLGLVLTIALAVPLWHYHVCRVEITGETLTALRAGGLFPGEPVTLRWDQIWTLSISSGRSRQQAAYMRTGQIEALDFTPVLAGVLKAIEESAKGHGVGILR